jgi:hypothetical protein
MACPDFDGKAITCMLTRTTVPLNDQHICPPPANCPKNKKECWFKIFLAKLKKIHLSKTFWINFIGAIVIYLNGTHLHFIPQSVLGEILLVANIILRFLSNKPLEEK